MKATASLSAFLLGLCLALPAAAETKIGYVNTEKIFRESQLVARVNKKLEQEFAKREQDVNRTINRLRDMQAALERESLTLSEAEKSRRQRDLANLNRDLQRDQRDAREEFNQRKNEEFATVHERARKTILEIAEREKFDLIVESVVYASPKVDLTDRVMRALDR